MSKTYFISDTHCFHGNIIKYAGRYWALKDYPHLVDQIREAIATDNDVLMRSIEIPKEVVPKMDDYIINKINCRVGVEDKLFILGDIGFANSANQFRVRVRGLRDRLLAGKVYLVWGNHDGLVPSFGLESSGRPQERDDYRAAVADIFDGVYEQVMVYCEGGIKIFCNHYPMTSWPDAHKPGLPGQANPHKTVALHCYGHVHGAYTKNSPTYNIFPLSSEFPWAAIDVGVDATDKWPWSAEEIWKFCSPQITQIIRSEAP